MNSQEGPAFVIGLVIGMLLSGIIVGLAADAYFTEKVIERDAAYYDQKTGKFTWKEVNQ